ncbi:MAG: aminotransferase class IV [Deltaproteobacteria bacterium]|nr:aminotransferase class IV [Deltaproteobacteria bacterium]
MTNPDRRIWIDGVLIPWKDATLHVLSQSAARGSLVFDVMSCHWLDDGPAVFGLREHVERFVRSAGLSGMTLPSDADALIAAVGETVHANPGCEVVKVNAYFPGIALDVLPADPLATVAVAAFSLQDVVPGPSGPRRPARLQIPDPRKMPPWVMSPQAKLAAGYLYASVAKAGARRDGFDDILLLDEQGNLAESAAMSFMLVEGERLCVPPLDYVLAGVTRRAVLDLARDEKIEIAEEPVPRDAIERASEAFLVGTTVNVWAVAEIDGHKLPEPVPGPISVRLAARMKAMLAGSDPLSARWLEKV